MRRRTFYRFSKIRQIILAIKTKNVLYLAKFIKTLDTQSTLYFWITELVFLISTKISIIKFQEGGNSKHRLKKDVLGKKCLKILNTILKQNLKICHTGRKGRLGVSILHDSTKIIRLMVFVKKRFTYIFLWRLYPNLFLLIKIFHRIIPLHFLFFNHFFSL